MGKKNLVFRPPSLEMRTMGCRNPYENGWIGWIGMIIPKNPQGHRELLSSWMWLWRTREFSGKSAWRVVTE